MPASTDRIEKTALLRAPRDRVWEAIVDARQFGRWFGVEFEGPFVAGTAVNGRMVPTSVDAEVAKAQEPYRGVVFAFFVQDIEPMRRFSFRWHPAAVEPGADPSTEPTTLVVFELEEVEGGTRLVITESGFEAIPIERRAQAFASNDEGWTAQLMLIGKYLAAGGAAV